MGTCSYPRALGVGVDHVHGLGGGVDGVSQFLFQAVVRLSDFPDAET